MGRVGRIGAPLALLALVAAGAPSTRAAGPAAEKVPGTAKAPGAEALPGVAAQSGLDLSDLLAPDLVVEVRESALNEAAAAIEPVRLTGQNPWRVPGWVPLVGGKAICDPDYTAEVSGITFAFAQDVMGVKARVRARWCGQAFTADVETTGAVAYDAAQRTLLVTIAPTHVRPSFVITIDVYAAEYEFEVPLPVTIDLAGIVAPAIRVESLSLAYETSNGTGTLHATPRAVSLVKGQGYLRLQSDLELW